MLYNLKKRINASTKLSVLDEAAHHVANNDDDIKDIFLDNPAAYLIGAENDPEIEKLVNSLPDTVEENDDITDEEIEEMTESYIPESIY